MDCQEGGWGDGESGEVTEISWCEIDKTKAKECLMIYTLTQT